VKNRIPQNYFLGSLLVHCVIFLILAFSLKDDKQKSFIVFGAHSKKAAKVFFKSPQKKIALRSSPGFSSKSEGSGKDSKNSGQKNTKNTKKIVQKELKKNKQEKQKNQQSKPDHGKQAKKAREKKADKIHEKIKEKNSGQDNDINIGKLASQKKEKDRLAKLQKDKENKKQAELKREQEKKEHEKKEREKLEKELEIEREKKEREKEKEEDDDEEEEEDDQELEKKLPKNPDPDREVGSKKYDILKDLEDDDLDDNNRDNNYDEDDCEDNDEKNDEPEEFNFFALSDKEQAIYHKKIQRDVQRLWRPPLGVAKGTKCVVSFVVAQDGKVESFEIIKRSNMLIYDLSIQRVAMNFTFDKSLWGKKFRIDFQQ
jgi:TonB-like protein